MRIVKNGVAATVELETSVMTTVQAAKYLGLTRDMVFKLTKNGELEAVRVGRDLLLDRQSVEEYAAARVTRMAQRLGCRLERAGVQ